VLADAELVAEDVAPVVSCIALLAQLVQLCHRKDTGDRHEACTAETSDLSFDATLGPTRRLRLIGRLDNNGCG
jgi:hypothetical protein